MRRPMIGVLSDIIPYPYTKSESEERGLRAEQKSGKAPLKLLEIVITIYRLKIHRPP